MSVTVGARMEIRRRSAITVLYENKAFAKSPKDPRRLFFAMSQFGGSRDHTGTRTSSMQDVAFSCFKKA